MNGSAELARPVAGRRPPPDRGPDAPSTRRPLAAPLRIGVPLAALLAVGGLWELAAALRLLPALIVPRPTAVLSALVAYLAANPFEAGTFYYHLGYTLAAALLGWLLGALLGVALAALISESPAAERLLQPYVVALQGMPKVAIAPILALWFRFSLWGTVTTVVLLTTFPVLINLLAGLRAVPEERVELARALGAGRWQTFWMVRFPTALPYLFAGLDLAIIYSLIGAVVGEFVGADRGLGTLVLKGSGAFRLDMMFAVFIVLAILGVGLHLAVLAAKRRIAFWEEIGQQVVGI